METKQPRWLKKQEDLLKQEAEDVGVPVISTDSRVAFEKTKWKHGDTHAWKRGDSLFDIAQSMHVELKQLMAYNELESYEELEEGILIYYPAPHISTTRQLLVEILEVPVKMHIAKPGGAKKWAFGMMTTWDDAAPNGYFPEQTNVHIVAVAKVPIEDKDDPFAEAAYYLDHAALGNYQDTGLLRFALGFAWSDLEEGHTDTLVKKQKPAEQPVSEVTEKQLNEAPAPAVVAQPRVPESLDGFDPAFVEQRLEDFKRDGSMHKFTETYQKLNPVVPCIATFPAEDPIIEFEPSTGHRFMWIRDFAMKRPNRRLFENQEVDIAATFEYNGDIYGRPAESVSGNNFFGIPMSMLESQDDVYNTDIDATTRAEIGGRLTWSERYVWVPINRLLAKYAPGYLRKIKTSKKG